MQLQVAPSPPLGARPLLCAMCFCFEAASHLAVILTGLSGMLKQFKDKVRENEICIHAGSTLSTAPSQCDCQEGGAISPEEVRLWGVNHMDHRVPVPASK